MTAIDVHGLVKRFGSRIAVDHVSMQVGHGEIVGFLGPNGSGKTTTIRIMCGLLTPDAGEGRVLGFDLRTQGRRVRREVGYMTQRFSFYEDLTIAENLEFVARLYELKPVSEHVGRTLDSLGLSARRDQLAGTLSGGWKQRLALAACVMHKPKLLLLDEPTAGVDPKARRDFWDEIHRLADEGLTVLVSTHYMDEAERCHRIGYIANGRMLATGTVDDVIREAGLTTFILRGPDLGLLSREVMQLPGVEQAAPFGTTLHVVGSDATLLSASLAPLANRPGTSVEPGQTSLEDVFIKFMADARVNAAPDDAR